MTIQDHTHSIKKTARAAGLLYLSLAPLGIFGLIYVSAALIVPDDTAATAHNILASAWLFRLSIVSALATQVVNIIVAFLLHRLLNPVGKDAAACMVVCILVGVPIAMLSEVFKFAALLLLSHPEHQTAFTPEQVRSLAALLLDMHRHSIAIAHIFWGLWLLPMGYLVFRSGYIPRILGVLLVIGGVGYLIDVLLIMLFPHVDLTISQFTFVGEVLLPLWLVVKGVNVERWEQRVRQPVAQHADQRAERQRAHA